MKTEQLIDLIKKCQQNDLRKADLSGMDLSGAELEGMDLSGANLEGCNLERADLRYTDLTGANLTKANLKNANLNDAILDGSNLDNAILDAINLPKKPATKNKKFKQKTVEIIKKAKKYYHCKGNGYTRYLLINNITKNLQPGVIVSLNVKDISRQSKHGTTVIYDPIEIIHEIYCPKKEEMRKVWERENYEELKKHVTQITQ